LLLENSRKVASSVKDRGWVDRSEADHKAPETGMSLRMPPQWPKLDIGSCCCASGGAVIDSRPEQNSRVKAGLNPRHHEQIAPMDRCSLLQRLRAFRIKQPHTAKMSGKVSLGDEVAQNNLVTYGHVPRRQRQGSNKRIDQPLRQNEISKPDRREKELAERPRVDDAIDRIETLERRQRRPGKAKFAVVVVLENNSPRLLGPAQEFQSPPQGERNAKRILSAGRNVDELGEGRGAPTEGNVKAFRVHGHGDGFGVRCF